jgi:hypothetical protein
MENLEDRVGVVGKDVIRWAMVIDT